tara:strand:+ start:725 stop:1393 length:669 start_codon:yes stop_codon:yes gene_type:complete
MPTINVNRQGTATGAVSSNFNTARTSAAGSVNDGDTSSSIHVQYFHSAGRGGLTKRFKRVFLHFDTSGITATVSAAHIDVRGNSSSDPNDTIMVKSTAFGGDGGTALATSDFYSSLDYSTAYSSELTSWSSGNNEYTLTAAALADIKNNNNFTLAIVEHDSDFRNLDQTNISDISINLGITITLDYTLAPVGYSNIVNGVASANIGEVIGVATANIEKVIGV